MLTRLPHAAWTITDKDGDEVAEVRREGNEITIFQRGADHELRSIQIEASALDDMIQALHSAKNQETAA